MQAGSVNEKYALPAVERQSAGSLDKNAFLQLFIAQLKNQDPLNPQDSSSFMAQLAQFGTLEQLANLNKEIVQLRLSQEMSEASALLGKRVKVEGEAIEGRVEKVSFAGDEVKLLIDGKSYGLYQVVEIFPEEAPVTAVEPAGSAAVQELLAASALLGRQVTILSDPEEITGTVEKAAFENGGLRLFVNGSGYSLEQVTEVK